METISDTFETKIIRTFNELDEVSDYRAVPGRVNVYESDECGSILFQVYDRETWADSCREVAYAYSNPEPTVAEIEQAWREEGHFTIDGVEYARVAI